MINHARTLLLNTQIPGSEIYIPPNFGPVAVPAYLQSFRQAALGDGENVQALEPTVDSWMGLLHQIDREPFILALDSRLTYKPLGRKSINRNKVRLAQRISATVLRAQPLAGSGKSGLFRHIPGYADELKELKVIWDNSAREEDKACAALAGYIYQLEGIRNG
jgi:hypothetical protein